MKRGKKGGSGRTNKQDRSKSRIKEVKRIGRGKSKRKVVWVEWVARNKEGKCGRIKC